MESIKRNRLISSILAIIVFIAAATVVIRPAENAAAEDDYTTWVQMDERWGSTPMGSSTVARSGCLITSLAIMAMHTGSLDQAALKNLGISSVSQFDPGVLANAYTARGAFSSGGGIASWGTITQIIPNITFVADSNLKSTTQHEIAAEIRSLLQSGLHIILNVNGHHWVYIEGVHEDDIYMMDPGSNERIVCDYYQLAGQNEYWSLKCAKPPTVEPVNLEYKDPLEYIMETEYCNLASENVPVYADSPVDNTYNSGSDVLFELKKGNVVILDAVYGNYGRMVNGGGWVDMNKLSVLYSYGSYEPGSGDINCDGITDGYDISILNDCIRAMEGLPEGVSCITANEFSVADMNYDGVLDDNDLTLLLRKVYNAEE